ncbi:GFA family protein [Brevundimonas vesicularis]|uniref:GFA family protein n=1 Tax=Brevundimonas vesicularis TaxID=41276 RepID=A0ABU4KS81_BREVE|nr:GFA family protein [Brevundimonas vesicularis]MDX2335746.1 GFA family protein [Brevundimonas vesicularis]
MGGNQALSGGCNCGAVRYRLEGPPMVVAACHCTRCRKQSGAAFSVNLIVRASTMTVEGDLAQHLDADTQSGAPVSREFCAACGSPIRSVPQANPKLIAVKAGTLDEPGGFAPAMHIWTRSALPWVEIPASLPQFPMGPQP